MVSEQCAPGNTLVVLKGSGRASDILCYGFENSIEIESEGAGGRKERKMPGMIFNVTVDLLKL